MLRFLQEASSLISKQNSEKKVDKMLKKLRVKLIKPLTQKILLEIPSSKKFKLRQEPRNKFSKVNKDSLLKNKKLNIIRSNWILKRLERRLLLIKNLPFSNKKVECMKRSLRLTMPKKKPWTSKELEMLRWKMTCPKRKWN